MTYCRADSLSSESVRLFGYLSSELRPSLSPQCDNSVTTEAISQRAVTVDCVKGLKIKEINGRGERI